MNCKCGCGRITPIYQRNKNRNGYKEIKGEHADFIPGHNRKGKSKALSQPRNKTRDGCLELVCCITEDGYTKFWAEDQFWYGHVYFWVQLYGPVPDNFVVDHKCQNRACSNVEHLRLLSRHDNMMVGKYGEKFLTDRMYQK